MSDQNSQISNTETSTQTAAASAPLVGVIMGSKSDLSVMEACTDQLDAMGISYELKIASAHRKPAEVHDWASNAAERGMQVIIAAAGKAAHLGGVVAAYTPLPVIAVPMKTSDLGGLDSLLSMVQMPSGVPVACVAINGAKNAAILAAQIIGSGATAGAAATASTDDALGVDGVDGAVSTAARVAQHARQAVVDLKNEMAEA